mmetsp:Transcript_62852/g.184312  ORF Transcript_62852/g.184312 Transcript_62852/m.184312 type:complete len:322 (-) Transcript_62852:621-1586(-)
MGPELPRDGLQQPCQGLRQLQWTCAAAVGILWMSKSDRERAGRGSAGDKRAMDIPGRTAASDGKLLQPVLDGQPLRQTALGRAQHPHRRHPGLARAGGRRRCAPGALRGECRVDRPPGLLRRALQVREAEDRLPGRSELQEVPLVPVAAWVHPPVARRALAAYGGRALAEPEAAGAGRPGPRDGGEFHIGGHGRPPADVRDPVQVPAAEGRLPKRRPVPQLPPLPVDEGPHVDGDALGRPGRGATRHGGRRRPGRARDVLGRHAPPRRPSCLSKVRGASTVGRWALLSIHFMTLGDSFWICRRKPCSWLSKITLNLEIIFE